MTARQIVEEVYEYILSKKAPIYEQIEPLNRTGELSDMRNLLKVIFRFGDVIEEQGKKIEELERLIKSSSWTAETDEKTTDTTGHNPDNLIQS